MNKLSLPRLTLIAVAGNRQAETVASMYKSMAQVEFAKCVLVTNIDMTATGIEVINVGGLQTWEAYNHFIVKELYKYFDTDYCLIVQWDGWILNADCWTDDYFEYDIVGAPGTYIDARQNYNGGFSLRSKKLQTIIAQDETIDITSPEDEILCRLYRYYLEKKHGIKYCSDEVGHKFSFELHAPTQKTFGFHAFHHLPYRETILIKRSHALGDVIMLEPVLRYYHEQGYAVALDTQEEFMKVYLQHYFPVIPKSMLNPKIKYRELDLNMVYEINPKRPVLESYYEIAGIKNEPLRNPVLNLWSGNNQKLFKKYCLIHIDDTGMSYRNQHGINWKSVVSYLEEQGYLVFQIGRRIQKEIATFLNTMSLEFMMFLMKGADLFIGVDSGPSHIAVGFNIPSVIMFGSVNPRLRHSNFDRIRIVQSECPKEETKNCYHSKVDVVGTDCVYDKEVPPCTSYTAKQIIDAIKTLV